MSSLTQSYDFRNYGTFILRINGCSIWYKDSRARADAEYYVLIDNRGKQIYIGSTVVGLIKTALHTPNKGKTPKKLTSAQRKKIAPILRKCNESIKDLDSL